MADAELILGWDVGGTKSAAVLGTRDGRIVAREEWASEVGRGPDAMRRDFLDAAAKLVEGHGGPIGVGVSIGGPMDAMRGVIYSPPHLSGWDDVPLAELLANNLHLPVVVEHDAAACLLAEHLWGGAVGATHAAYLTCGTGCGAGVLIEGRVLRGPGGQSPELGHVRLAPDGPVMFGKAGCLESFASGAGIADLAPFMFPDHFDGPVPPKRLLELAGRGDEQAAAVLAGAGRRLGQACAILVDLFAPQVILLGTLARRFGPAWVAGVHSAMADESLADRAACVRIEAANLGDRLQDLSPIAAFIHRRS